MDFAHCVAVKCIYVFLLFPEMLCFLALCQIIYLFMYFYYFQKSRNFVFWHCARLFVYLCISIISRSQKCYIFRHCARLFVYLCIHFISRSPEMLYFQALCQIICLCIYFISRSPEMLYFQSLCTSGSSQWSVFETDITMSWINTNTVNKHFFSSSVTHRSTSRYIVDQIVWQWIE